MDDTRTGGGASVEGDASTGGGRFTGRDDRSERSSSNMYVVGDHESDWRRVDAAINNMGVDIRFLAEKVENLTRMLYHAATFKDKMERQIKTIYIIGIIVALLLLAAGIWVFWHTDRSLFALSERIKELEYMIRQNWTPPERFP